MITLENILSVSFPERLFTDEFLHAQSPFDEEQYGLSLLEELLQKESKEIETFLETQRVYLRQPQSWIRRVAFLWQQNSSVLESENGREAFEARKDRIRQKANQWKQEQLQVLRQSIVHFFKDCFDIEFLRERIAHQPSLEANLDCIGTLRIDYRVTRTELVGYIDHSRFGLLLEQEERKQTLLATLPPGQFTATLKQSLKIKLGMSVRLFVSGVHLMMRMGLIFTKRKSDLFRWLSEHFVTQDGAPLKLQTVKKYFHHPDEGQMGRLKRQFTLLSDPLAAFGGALIMA